MKALVENGKIYLLDCRYQQVQSKGFAHITIKNSNNPTMTDGLVKNSIKGVGYENE